MSRLAIRIQRLEAQVTPQPPVTVVYHDTGESQECALQRADLPSNYEEPSALGRV
jgi:hypothetical protein